MASALNASDLLDLLASGKVIVVPTLHAAAALQERHCRSQRAQGKAAWFPARALCWQEWLHSLWDRLLRDGHENRVLLNRCQEDALWYRIIAQSSLLTETSEVAVHELARLAQKAFGLAGAFRAVARLPRSADGPDTRAFAEWTSDFLRICDAKNLISPALLAEALGEHLRLSQLESLPKTHLVGFERLSPAQQVLLEDLEHVGAQIHTHPVSALTSSPLRARVELPSPGEQLQWAAQWLREELGRHEGQAHLALLISDPISEPETLEAVLRSELAPELEWIGADLAQAPWSFTAGTPLREHLLLRHTLLLLRWLTEPIAPAQVTTVLLSPFFELGATWEQRAQLDAALRSRPQLHPERSIDAVLAVASKLQLKLPNLESVARDFARFGSHRLGHAEGTELVRTLLHTAGWLTGRTFDARELAAATIWSALLDSVASLDLLEERTTFAQLIDTCEREAAVTTVTGDTTSPVQILSPSDAEGMLFDAALLLNATGDQFPPPERTNPLLSWTLQQDLHMPGATRQHTYQQALEHLAQRVGTLLLLTPAADANGPLHPVLFEDLPGFPQIASDQLLRPLPHSEQVALTWAPESAVLPPLPFTEVPGGARVLELQAACGFRAFASMRLGASTVDEATLGLNPRQAGNTLHRALELFWRDVRSRDELQNLSPEQRSKVVGKAVTQALATQKASSAVDRWTTAYLQVVEQRFRQLLHAWLARELERAPFTVQQQEQGTLVHVGPLSLRVRPDRVDQVAEGLVYIDYKSSSQLSPGDWLGERPRLPQLPLYSLLSPADELRAIAFGQLRPGKGMRWISLQSEIGLFPGRRIHELQQQHELWKAELDRLAIDFASGDIRVRPKEYPHTCVYCESKLLCRVDPEVAQGTAVSPEQLHG